MSGQAGAATLVGSYDLGAEVPDFELPTLNGGMARLSDYRGRPVLIFFTATWCPYCGAEAPYLEQEIWRRYQERGLQVVCIDVKEHAAVMWPFVERYGWTFPVLLDDEGEVSMRFAPIKEGLPPEVAIINAHFILDAEGVVVYLDFLNMERFDARAAHVRALRTSAVPGLYRGRLLAAGRAAVRRDPGRGRVERSKAMGYNLDSGSGPPQHSEHDHGGRTAMPDLIPCPDPSCRAPAEIVDRWTFTSSQGPVAHLKTRCERGHHFTPTVDSLTVPDAAEPVVVAATPAS